MQGGIDWHIHTWEGSRESVSYKKVVDIAIDAMLTGISITDHHSVAAIKAAQEYAQNRLIVIPGMEQDGIIEGQKVHIVGYYPNMEHFNFQKDLDSISNGRMTRMYEIILRFAENQLIPEDDVNDIMEKLCDVKVYTTMAVAEILINKYSGTETKLGEELKRLEDTQNYITPRGGKQKGQIDLQSKLMYEYLDRTRPCYVGYEAGKIADWSEVVRFCLKYDSPCGWAHLRADLQDEDKVRRAFNAGIDNGMTVLGVGHPEHDRDAAAFLFQLSKSRRTIFDNGEVVALHGTDYHAKKGKPSIGDIRSMDNTMEQVNNYCGLLANR